jgi:molybdopterin synthase sulfur carrier subunit
MGTLKSMKIQILLFGIARDIVGQSLLELEHHEPLNVKAFKQILQDKYPKMNHLSYFKVAINQEFAEDEQQLKEGDEIALIPPVAGG